MQQRFMPHICMKTAHWPINQVSTLTLLIMNFSDFLFNLLPSTCPPLRLYLYKTHLFLHKNVCLWCRHIRELFYSYIIIAMYLQSRVSRGVFSIEPLGEIRPAVYSHSKSNPPPLPLSQDDMLRFEKRRAFCSMATKQINKVVKWSN